MSSNSQYIREVTTESFQQDVLQRSREVPVLVDFWATWCEPCKTLSPTLEAVTDAYGGQVELAKVDVDANPDVSAQFVVQSIPTVVAIRDGKEVSRFIGVLPESSIRDFINNILPTEHDRMVEQARDAMVTGDNSTAEHLLRQVLDSESDHHDAGTSLAALLIDRGDIGDALIVLGKLVPNAEVDRLQAAARLRQRGGDDIGDLEVAAAENPDSDRAQLDLAQALAARSQYEPALDKLLALVAKRGEGREEARQAMVDIFEVLGNEHPLTSGFRRRLAAELF
jgi:putative thioredoxin